MKKQDEVISGKQDKGKFWFSCGSASNSIVSAPQGWPLIVPCIVHCWRLCLSSVPSSCPQTLSSSLLLPFYACVGWNMVSLSHFSLQPYSLRANFQFIFIELSNIRTVRNSSVDCFCMMSIVVYNPTFTVLAIPRLDEWTCKKGNAKRICTLVQESR